MIHTPVEVMQKYMIDQGWFSLPSLSSSWPLWVSYFPEAADIPANAGVLYDLPAQIDGRVLSSGEIMDHKRMELRIRTAEDKYPDGWLKLQTILEALALLVNAEVLLDASTYTIQTVTNLTGVISLGLEGQTSRRRLFSMDLQAPIVLND